MGNGQGVCADMMFFKKCNNCGHDAWHNKCGGKDGGMRCTKCAYPAGTGPKKDRHEAAMRAVIAKGFGK